MKRKRQAYLTLLALLPACLGLWCADGPPAARATVAGLAPDDTLRGTPNRLIHEQSPYLLQHAYNPVDWYPWGEEAFQKARQEDKPVFLSIGYSTCHWCHVMERESFEDSTVAALLNDAFVAIKVDREERPDIDHIYMDVAQRMNGRGGWPLNIVMTPDQQPFFAGTYFPKTSRGQRIGMLDLIPRLQALWTEKRDQVLDMSAQVQAALQPPAPSNAETRLTPETLTRAYDALAQRFDSTYGGFGPAPKFPRAHDALFLLRHAQRTGNTHALAMAEATLQALRRGGIYDHIGFGFHRYATDAKWLVPHFEKMLYDQALLALAYTEAYEATQNPRYAQTAREILTYVLRDMTGPEGGFYSAEDADSEEEEGKFYLWTLREVQAALPEADARLAATVFNLSAAGNFIDPTTGARTGTNILHRTQTLAHLAAQEGVSVDALQERLETLRQTLFAVRVQRIPPYKDDKILTDWNGLMIAALAKAGRALEEPAFTAAARRAAGFLWTTLRDPQDRLLHRYRGGEAAHLGNLDDYAALIWGLLELYETTFDVRYLDQALALQADQNARFLGENGSYYFTPSDGETLLIRPQKWEDGAWPAGQSITLMNLLRLGKITAAPAYEAHAEALMNAAAPLVDRGPAWYTHLQQGLAFALGPTLEVVIAGAPDAPDTQAMLKALRARYVPNKVVLLRPPGDAPAITERAPFTKTQRPRGGQATAYVCRSYACELPTTDVDQMLTLIDKAQR